MTTLLPLDRLQVRFLLHRKQMDFLDSPALYRGFCGGRGAGKSYIGAYDLIKRSRRGRLYLVAAPTYPILRDTTFRSFVEVAMKVRRWRSDSWHKSDFRVVLGNGAEFLFRSADDPEKLRGPNLSGVWLDEASLMRREAFDICIASLREQGELGFLSLTFTPKGKLHWSYEVFQNNPDAALITATTAENPFLPETFERTVRGQYTSRLAAQELEGQFLEGEGYLFSRSWFPIVEVAPVGLTCVRAWDLAASEQKQDADPDWTAGVLLGRDRAGIFYMVDVRHVRATPRTVQDLIVQTARTDGRDVAVWMEEEGGSSGKIVTEMYTRLLAGYAFHGERATGSKVARAQPLAAQAEAGNVRLVQADWNKTFLDEFETMPFGPHDDIVDATALAFSKLALGPYKRFNVIL